jgi:hypothetical protein
MPPRRSARLAAATAPPDAALSPLPLPLVLHIFSLLTADERARAACVCRGWRVTLDEVSLWTRLDLSPSSGVRVRVTDAVLAAAAAKARGQLAALDVRGCVDVTFDAQLVVVQANAGALRELCVGAPLRSEQALEAEEVESLLLAAPQLTCCHADVYEYAYVETARRMLRNEPPFQPLRLVGLIVGGFDDADGDDPAAYGACVPPLAADLAAHASLKHVCLMHAPLDNLVALDAVVDAALARQLVSLYVPGGGLSPESASALVRLLGSGTLTELEVDDWGRPLLDAPAAALLGAALRANTTLTKLSLRHADLWHETEAAAVLLSALTGHESLRTLNLATNGVAPAHQAAAGAALGALVAANAPALTELNVSYSDLRDAGLRPLLEALPANTHLRKLDVSYNCMSIEFTRDVLLPAARSNLGLHELVANENVFIYEAEALVAARGAAARGAAARGAAAAAPE